MHYFISCPKKLSSVESSLTMVEAQVEASVSNASATANITKSAQQDAQQLESDSKDVSLKQLDGKQFTGNLHYAECTNYCEQLLLSEWGFLALCITDLLAKYVSKLQEISTVKAEITDMHQQAKDLTDTLNAAAAKYKNCYKTPWLVLM